MQIDKSDFWAKDNNGQYYHITEGTGDNLSPEDLNQGYVDYIYYDIYDSINDIHEDDIYDGGIIMLEKLYVEMSLEEIIQRLEEFEDVKLEAVI